MTFTIPCSVTRPSLRFFFLVFPFLVDSSPPIYTTGQPKEFNFVFMAFQELNSDYNIQSYHGNYCYPECQSSPPVANSREKRLNQGEGELTLCSRLPWPVSDAL